MRTRPENLYQKYNQELDELYELLDKITEGIMNLASGSVSSYSLGNRSISYQDLDKLKSLREETEARICELEAKLSHRSPRCVTSNVFICPSTTLPRKL